MNEQQTKIEDILQTCLDRVMSRQDTIDSVLSAYPDKADLLRPWLETALLMARLSAEVEPKPDFIPLSRRRLVEQIRQTSKARTPSPLGAWISWLTRSLTTHQRSRVAYIGLTLLFSLALLLSTGVALVNAQASLPGDEWYALKITQEKFALALSLDDAHDAQLSVEYTKRRLGEVKQLISTGRYEYVELSIEQYRVQVDQTVRSLDEVAHKNATQAKELAVSFNSILADQNREFIELLASVPDSTRARLAQAMIISRDGMNAIQELIEPPFDPSKNATPTRAAQTATASPTSTATPTASPTTTRTNRPRRSQSPTLEISPTSTEISPSPTPTPTETPLPTNTRPPTATLTPFPTQTPVITDLPAAPTDTALPTATPQPTITRTPKDTPTPLPTSTPIPLPTATQTSIPTPTPYVPPDSFDIPTATP